MSSDKIVGVIGAGSFGAVLANILAKHSKILLYVRDSAYADQLRNERLNKRGSISYSEINIMY